MTQPLYWIPFGFVWTSWPNNPLFSRISGSDSSLIAWHHRILRLKSMDPAETQRLQQQVDQLTLLVSQLMEGQVAQAKIPAPPRVSAPVPVTMPEKYDGNPDRCQAFLIQCRLYMEEHLEHFVEETAHVHFVISHPGM